MLCVCPHIYCNEITATGRCLKLTCVESYICNIIAILSKIFGETPLILSGSCAFFSGRFSLFHMVITERKANR